MQTGKVAHMYNYIRTFLMFSKAKLNAIVYCTCYVINVLKFLFLAISRAEEQSAEGTEE